MDSADESTIELREVDGEEEPAASPMEAIRAYMRHSPLSGLLLLSALAAFGWAIYLLCAETLTGHTDPPRSASTMADGEMLNVRPSLEGGREHRKEPKPRGPIDADANLSKKAIWRTEVWLAVRCVTLPIIVPHARFRAGSML